MKVKMASNAAGPDGVHLAGKVYEIPDAKAASWIDAGFAVAAADGKGPAEVLAPPEMPAHPSTLTQPQATPDPKIPRQK